MALLKVEPESPLAHLRFSETEQPIPGEWAIALGNPFGLFEASEPTVTVGVVSGVGRDFQPQENRIYRDMIQTDASINQGNSGGPLINALGEVIGVNTFIYSQSGGSIGLGFAVPAYKARDIVDELRRTGRVDRSYYTGLRGIDVNERIARALGLTDESGFIVRDVDPGSPAEDAGFRPYDVIYSFEGEPVAGQLDLAARLFDFRPGDVVHFKIHRDGQDLDLTMQLGSQENVSRTG
jgi:serine protease Do